MSNKITASENLLETIEFNYHQGRHDFNASFWTKFIDDIKGETVDELTATKERLKSAENALFCNCCGYYGKGTCPSCKHFAKYEKVGKA